MPDLRFHRETLELALQSGTGFPIPYIRNCSAKLVDQFEAKHGIVVPAAVREWYSLPSALVLLHRDKSDHFLYPDEWHWGADDGVILFMAASGGWRGVGVRLGSEDPEVVSQDPPETGAGPCLPWKLLSRSFSEFLINYVRGTPVYEAKYDPVTTFAQTVGAWYGKRF